MIEQEWDKLIKVLESSKKSLPPKIYGKIRELFYNPNFREKVSQFRHAWNIPVNGVKHDDHITWITETFLKNDINLLKNTSYKKKIDQLRGKAEREVKNRPVEIWDINKIKSIQRELLHDGEKGIFEKEILKITEVEFGLYPIDFWVKWLDKFLVLNELSLPSIYENPHCRLEPKLNKDTAEIELYLKIDEYTSIRDIQGYWKIIKTAQNELKKDKKGIEKRYYPKPRLSRDYNFLIHRNIYEAIDDLGLSDQKASLPTYRKAKQIMKRKLAGT